MECLEKIQEQLIEQVKSQMSDLKCVDTKELGEVIDMIKDLAEAVYYCEISTQMKKAGEKDKGLNNYYYSEKYYPVMPHYYDEGRDMDRPYGRMYYHDRDGYMSYYAENQEDPSFHTNHPYTERDYPLYLRDEREGRSPMKRKMFLESKITNQDSAKAMKDLESYMQDLTTDMMELLDQTTPEEKAALQRKINTLASKIQNV